MNAACYAAVVPGMEQRRRDGVLLHGNRAVRKSGLLILRAQSVTTPETGGGDGCGGSVRRRTRLLFRERAIPAAVSVAMPSIHPSCRLRAARCATMHFFARANDLERRRLRARSIFLAADAIAYQSLTVAAAATSGRVQVVRFYIIL